MLILSSWSLNYAMLTTTPLCSSIRLPLTAFRLARRNGSRSLEVSPQWHQRAFAAPFHDLADSPAVLKHRDEVRQISADVKGFYDRGERFRIFHGSTNSTRKSAVDRDPKKTINTSDLNHVLHVDPEKQIAIVQPNVPMDRLVEATLKYDLVPPVVPEFPGITCGGGFSGTTGESSSFKHGFFDRTLNRIEMVMADGTVVTCSEEERPDLFRGAAGAVGTLGVTTLVEIQLRKAAKYVETTYHPVSSMPEAITVLKGYTSGQNGDYDYVDGIMYSQSEGAIVTGKLTNDPTSSSAVQRFSDAWDPWFYMHVQDQTRTQKGPVTEAIPLPEYLFRYDRGGFWVGRISFSYFKNLVPFTKFTRWWLDDFLHTRMLYKALHGSGQDRNLIIQDLAMPYESAAEFVRWTDEHFGIWPMWLCPLKQSPKPTMHPQLEASDAEMLNIGLWGILKSGVDAVKANRDIEEKLRELGGMKWLYAQTYYAAGDFWQQFDVEWYKALRNKYAASGLPSVHDKVKVDIAGDQQGKGKTTMWERVRNVWPFAGFYGLRKAIESRTYMQARNSTWKDWVPR